MSLLCVLIYDHITHLQIEESLRAQIDRAAEEQQRHLMELRSYREKHKGEHQNKEAMEKRGHMQDAEMDKDRPPQENSAGGLLFTPPILGQDINISEDGDNVYMFVIKRNVRKCSRTTRSNYRSEGGAFAEAAFFCMISLTLPLSFPQRFALLCRSSSPLCIPRACRAKAATRTLRAGRAER